MPTSKREIRMKMVVLKKEFVEQRTKRESRFHGEKQNVHHREPDVGSRGEMCSTKESQEKRGRTDRSQRMKGNSMLLREEK
jgi:hypothetical protein